MTNPEDDAVEEDLQATLQVKMWCQLARQRYADYRSLRQENSSEWEYEFNQFNKLKSKAVVSGLTILDEFARSVAIHQLIDLHLAINDTAMASELFHSLEDQFFKDQVLEKSPGILEHIDEG